MQEDNGTTPSGPGLSSSGSSPAVSPPDGASIPSAAWVNYHYRRPVDLTDRGAGFIDGFAAACASLSHALCGDPDAGKSYDPMWVEPDRGVMFSYVFNMKDGGRSHSLSDYRTFDEIADCLLRETLEIIADEPTQAYYSLRRINALTASGIAARSDETPQEVRPEGQEPGGEAETPKPQV